MRSPPKALCVYVTGTEAIQKALGNSISDKLHERNTDFTLVLNRDKQTAQSQKLIHLPKALGIIWVIGKEFNKPKKSLFNS